MTRFRFIQNNAKFQSRSFRIRGTDLEWSRFQLMSVTCNQLIFLPRELIYLKVLSSELMASHEVARKKKKSNETFPSPPKKKRGGFFFQDDETSVYRRKVSK